MRTHRTGNLLAALSLAALLPVAACSPTEEDAKPAEAAVSVGGGPFARLTKLMDKLELRADQRARIEGTAKSLEAKHATAAKLRQEAALELARELRAGQLDRARLEALIKRGEAQLQALRPSLVAALDDLHRTLTPAQRRKLVAELGKRHSHGPRRHGPGEMRGMVKLLGLSDDQIDRIQVAVMAGGGPGGRLSRMMKLHAQLESAGESFVGEGFDAGSLEILKQAPTLMRERLTAMIGIGERVLPILTPEQRSLGAGLIEAHTRLAPH